MIPEKKIPILSSEHTQRFFCATLKFTGIWATVPLEFGGKLANTRYCIAIPNVSLQLLNEVSKPHILYKKCIYMSLIPKFESMDRKILKEELGILKHRPPRPSIQCVVSRTYPNYMVMASYKLCKVSIEIERLVTDENC